MKSVHTVRILVVADSDHALVFAARLRRMKLGEIITATNVDDARELCRGGGIDACIVTVDDTVLDARPSVPGDAPGRGCGLPTLMLVAAVSPALRKLARRAGYVAAIPGRHRPGHALPAAAGRLAAPKQHKSYPPAAAAHDGRDAVRA
jgi:hypothetical protein